MSSFIEFTTIALVLVYIGVAAWKICTCRTISGSIGVSCAFLIGGFFILLVAYSVATVVCWVVAIAIVLALIGAFFG